MSRYAPGLATLLAIFFFALAGIPPLSGVSIRFAISGGLLLLLWVVLPQDYETVRNTAMPRGTWVLLLPVSIAAILVQAGTAMVAQANQIPSNVLSLLG